MKKGQKVSLEGRIRDKSTAINFQETTIDKIPGWSIMQVGKIN